ncbi:MAG TPA: hypothetical protein DIW77_12165 [Chromatiaceae bacterium]|nr:hypothetical protein [Chromatiaceae bacterium]
MRLPWVEVHLADGKHHAWLTRPGQHNPILGSMPSRPAQPKPVIKPPAVTDAQTTRDHTGAALPAAANAARASTE